MQYFVSVIGGRSFRPCAGTWKEFARAAFRTGERSNKAIRTEGDKRCDRSSSPVRRVGPVWRPVLLT